MIHPFSAVLRHLAVIAALLAATGLAACGRKGPLEPPSAEITQPPHGKAADAKGGKGQKADRGDKADTDQKSASADLSGGLFAPSSTPAGKHKGPPPAMDESGHPLAQPSKNSHFILDFLLN